MTVDLVRILDGHNLRRARIDSAVAPSEQLRSTDRTFRDQAAGCVVYQGFEAHDYAALWGPLHRYKLEIRVHGDQPVTAFDAVLSELLNDVSPVRQADDSAVVITWPSRDIDCASALVSHGFAPLTVLALHELGPPSSASATRVRPAHAADVDQIVSLAMRLHEFEARLGALPRRPGLQRHLSDEVSADINNIWVAPSDSGEVAGFIHAQPPRNAWIENQVTPRPAAYLTRLYVRRSQRNLGLGRALVEQAHAALWNSGAKVVLLHHTVHNPFGVLWARLGYRFVFTTWTLR